MSFDDDLRQIWEDRVNSRYLYRGMSSKDLVDPLDPSRDPFKEIRKELLELIGTLQALADAGLEFRLREEHFGNVYWHEYRSIVKWSRRDLEDSGIDFTTSYKHAKEYSDCHQGSQLKQNLKSITDHLQERRDDPVVSSVMSQEKWQLLSAVGEWVSECSPQHRGVVVCVRRSCPVFESRKHLLPIGTFGHFRENVERVLSAANSRPRAESVGRLLPAEEDGFEFRLRSPLPLKHIEAICG